MSAFKGIAGHRFRATSVERGIRAAKRARRRRIAHRQEREREEARKRKAAA